MKLTAIVAGGDDMGFDVVRATQDITNMFGEELDRRGDSFEVFDIDELAVVRLERTQLICGRGALDSTGRVFYLDPISTCTLRERRLWNLYHVLLELGVPLLNRSFSANPELEVNKTVMQTFVGKFGIPCIPTVELSALTNVHLFESSKPYLKFPLLLKPNRLSNGIGVLKCDSRADFVEKVRLIGQLKLDYLIQEFVSHTGDLRVFVSRTGILGHQLRRPADGDFRANLSNGARWQEATLPSRVQDWCLHIASQCDADYVVLDWLVGDHGFTFNEMCSTLGAFMGVPTDLKRRIAETILDLAHRKLEESQAQRPPARTLERCESASSLRQAEQVLLSRSSIPERSNVPVSETWSAESVFETRNHWRGELLAVRDVLADLREYPGTLASSPKRLSSWLNVHHEIARRVDRLVFYATMAAAVDTGDPEAVAMAGQARSLAAQHAATTAFAEPEIAQMEVRELQRWLDTEQPLAPFRHYLENVLRRRQHICSVEVERALGLLEDPFSATFQTFEMLSSNDLQVPDAIGADGEVMQVTQSSIESIKRNPDREMRCTGMNNYADAYRALRHTYAHSYIAAAKQAHAKALIRGYASVIESTFEPHHLPVAVLRKVIDVCRSNLPLWHRFWEVKRQHLGYDVLRSYDVWAPLTRTRPHFSYPQAVDLIARAMSPLGDEYIAALRRGCLEARWVDYARNRRKVQGAFSYGTFDTAPCILMSFDGALSGVSTLAHELGHSMHSYLTWRAQPYVYSQYSMFVAEVASNFNQAMVRRYLLADNPGRDMQLAVIEEAIECMHRYLFIMPILTQLEDAVYCKLRAGEPLNADVLEELTAGLYSDGYGASLEDDVERTAITWATFGHIYQPYVSFQYVTGISAALALCNGVSARTPGAVEAYLRFLSLGSSRFPLDVLAAAGVDMTSTEPVEAAFEVLKGFIERLERLSA